MQNLISDLREFIELLNSHEVRYLIVGGFAVAFHGYPRLTGDIDFFLDSTPENAQKIQAVLRDFGFGSLGLTADDFTRPNQIVQLGFPPNRIDLLTSISGATFPEAWESRVGGELEGIAVTFVGKETLLVNKAASGRPKDMADLDALR
jgi:predicted nucleotidyltransferase